MPVFFITSDQVRNGGVTITGSLLHHLRASLRIRVGEDLRLVSERQHVYRITVTSLDRLKLIGRVQEAHEEPVPAHSTVTIAQALLKGDRMDWAIQKATELGAAAIVPLLTARTIVRPRPARVSTQQERWQRIAREAAQQAERREVPPIHPPIDATEFFRSHPPADLHLILGERDPGQSLATMALPDRADSHVILVVGPEGGWTREELASARECGFVPVTLGPRILRAETAALAALSVLQSRLGELG